MNTTRALPTVRRRGVAAALLAISAAVIGPGLAHRIVLAQPGPPPADMPACRIGDLAATATGYNQWAETLLDTEHRLDSDYRPPDLVQVDGARRAIKLRSLVVPDLRAMLDAAHDDGVRIELNSGYRGYGTQAAIFERNVSERGEEFAHRSVALPGHSEHQLGTTLDFGGDHQWLANNAWRFGFVMSYPPGRSQWTCYKPEPWHYRYFGRQRAALIQASGLSPREFLWLDRQPRSASARALQAGGHAIDGQVDEPEQLVPLRVVVGH
jgi:D-alanyl-D-alanine carboxypeptidase